MAKRNDILGSLEPARRAACRQAADRVLDGMDRLCSRDIRDLMALADAELDGNPDFTLSLLMAAVEVRETERRAAAARARAYRRTCRDQDEFLGSLGIVKDQE